MTRQHPILRAWVKENVPDLCAVDKYPSDAFFIHAPCRKLTATEVLLRQQHFRRWVHDFLPSRQ